MSSNRLSEIIMSKWQRLAAKGGRKWSKGHFVVYAKGGKRYVVPLKYLDHPIFQVLLEMAEEEFGTTSHGPLRVPCEEELMEHIVFLLKTNPAEDVEKALVSITSFRGPSFSSLFPLCHSQNNRHNIVL
ncbi:auxin-responsive protein SAUR36 [Elaeis guineensis]|uniref:Auxin-responsive protein SAUR36 n=1 Tax=Elaeis guineensis var. tenera TaxID=51953 RepID=A0A6I9R0H1_ELAGV|nr:auxin-responsive protein SAUR36 [Elaeis guineensis]